jgi:hypothetical protein
VGFVVEGCVLHSNIFDAVLSLSFGGVGDWRVRFLSDVFLAVQSDPELPDWVEATLATTWG